VSEHADERPTASGEVRREEAVTREQRLAPTAAPPARSSETRRTRGTRAPRLDRRERPLRCRRSSMSTRRASTARGSSEARWDPRSRPARLESRMGRQPERRHVLPPSSGRSFQPSRASRRDGSIRFDRARHTTFRSRAASAATGGDRTARHRRGESAAQRDVSVVPRETTTQRQLSEYSRRVERSAVRGSGRSASANTRPGAWSRRLRAAYVSVAPVVRPGAASRSAGDRSDTEAIADPLPMSRSPDRE